MHAQIIFNAMQTFGLVLKKIKTIFCVLLGKIECGLQKYHILMLNMSIIYIYIMTTFIIWTWLNLNNTVHQHAFQYHSAIWAYFSKNINNL